MDSHWSSRYVIPLDKKLSNLLRSAGADNRQAFDRSCTKEALNVDGLPGFMGENRRRRETALEQFSCCQANSERCRSGWDCVVFNIKNNDARLITYINYELGTVTVLAVLTHKEY